MTKKISIIIPAYNEDRRIEKTLRAYAGFFNKDTEILIILNGCRDNTLNIVKKVKDEFDNINYWVFEKAMGKGGAVIEGFKVAGGDLIGFVDADLATVPEAFNDLIINIGNYDGIIASRYISGARILNKQSLKRRFASRVFNIIVRILFFMNYKDTQCGAKIFKNAAIKKIVNKMTETNWTFDVELLYLMKKHKLKIKEFPTVWKEPGDSRLKLNKVGPEMFFSIIKLRINKLINN